MPKYIGKQIALPESKLLHPHLMKPSDTYKKYEVMAVIDPGRKDEWKEVEDAIVDIACQAFGLTKAEARKQIKEGKLTSPIGPHKAKDPNDTSAPAKETGDIVFSARQDASKGGPDVVDEYLEPIPEDRASEIYYGIYGVVVVFLMAYSAPRGKGVTARINVVQKLRDAEGGGGRGQAMKLLKAKAKPVVKAAETSSGDDEVDEALDRLLA